MSIMVQSKVPQHVIKDLDRFIFDTYHDDLPNSLLIAQAFILSYQSYGKEYGLYTINCVIEDEMKNDLF